MEFLNRVLAQLAEVWRGLTTPRKVLFALVAAGALIGLIVYLVLSPVASGYVAIAPEVPLEEAQEITTRLQSAAIPFKLENGGSRITVPEDRLAQARVLLAAEGYPTRGGKGLELLESSSLGATPFQQTVAYQRALQGELARSIAAIDGISGARVIIAKPESTPFVRDQKPTTASVVLTLKPTRSLEKKTAHSIVSLVARSVEGLKPENVTIVDSQGRLLSDPYAGQREELAGVHLDYRRELEADLAKKAEDVLTGRLGAGRAVVRVTADIDFKKVKEQSTNYSPDKVVQAERTNTSSSTNSRGSSGGIPGTTSNVSRPGSGAAAGGSGGTSKEEVQQTDYAVSKTVREVEDRMGNLTRLTVAVVADLSSTPEGVPPMTVEEAEALVKQAVGFKTGRDEIKVTNSKVGGPATPPPAEDPEEAARLVRIQGYVQLARNTALFTAIFMSLAIIVVLMFRKRPKPEAERAAIEKLDRARAEAEKVVIEQARAKSALEERRREMMNKLMEMCRESPEKVVEILGVLVGPAAK